MQKQLRRTWIEVDLDAIEENIKIIKTQLATSAQFMAVVKADAYSHGAPVVSAALDKHDLVSFFGVSSFDEAVQIRAAGVKKPILILGYTPPYLANDLVDYDITQMVYSLEYAKKLSDALSGGQLLKAHIKLDTGMCRLGIVCHSPQAVPSTVLEIKNILSLPSLDAQGLFTHFADSDNFDTDFCNLQFDMMHKVVTALSEENISFKYAHACNSGGVEYHSEHQLVLVRCGLLMYGYSQHPEHNTLPFRPAMQLKSLVTQIKTIDEGATVSYNRAYTAPSRRKIAVISIGYADGYSRALSNVADVLINGRRARILGVVCMDQLMVDITHIEDVEEGQTVTIFGSEHGATLSVEELSEKSGNTVYTTLCGLGIRVPRVYKRGGLEIDVTNYINR